MENIGDHLRAARKAKGLTQEALAYRASISVNQVARLERNEIADPHYSTLAALALALGVPVADLTGEQPRPKALAR